MRHARTRVWSRTGAAVLLLLSSAASAYAQQAVFTISDVLDLPSASAGALSPDGRSLVVTTAALRDRIGIDNYRYGDPTYVAPSAADITIVDTRTGQSRRLFNDKRQARAFAWSPDNDRLAFLLRDGDVFRPMIWDRNDGRLSPVSLPPGVIAADNAELQWSDDGGRLFIATRTQEWQRTARARFEREVKGPIVVLKSGDPFLSWDEIRRLSLERSLHVIWIANDRIDEVLPARKLASYEVTGGLLRYNEDITAKTDYERIGGAEATIKVRDIATGTERTLAANTRNFSPTWSGDGKSYVFTRENRIWFATLADTTPRALTEAPPRASRDSASAADSTARAQAARERLTPTRLSHDGTLLIASNRQGLWLVDTRTAQRELLFEMPPRDTTQAAPYSVVAWSRDNSSIYLTYAARDKWERGLYRIDRATKQLRELVKDSRRYAGWRLSDDGGTLLFTMAEGARPADVYAANADFTNVRRLTQAGQAVAAKKVSATRLIDYLDADGNKLYGVLYLPVDYDATKRYPTVFIVYEGFFDEGFNSTVSLLTANGYAVMQPSVRLETGYPGEAWLKGVTAAANKLIELGIADGDRLGVHGTSYGGYATNLLITQTNRFKAAINISGKVDMISFYTDSPRLGVRNIHAPERSQDRIGATLWEQPQKYVAHSAIMSADRIRTPLLLMTGSQDHNVPERTTMEMYYALRRLGREVEWVSYVNGGHGMPTSTAEEVIDYHQRILGWYDKYLKSNTRSATN
jgi:dipeptidyl aminopeptidase/acylaminoacyl peptidase